MIRIWLTVVALFCASACIPRVQGSCTAHVRLRADPMINPSAQGRPTPTVVRLWALPDHDPIPLDFDTFWDSILHEGVEHQMYPEENHTTTLAITSEHHRVVMAALLRKPGRFRWLAVQQITTCGQTLTGVLGVQGPSLRMETAP